MNCDRVVFEPLHHMNKQSQTITNPEILKNLVPEVVNIFLGLSWALQQYSQKITQTSESEKRSIYLAPLNVSLGLVSTNPIQDSSLRTCKLCTHILRTVGNYQKLPETDLYKFSRILSSELRACIVDIHFKDQHPLILALLAEFDSFYECKKTQRDFYWKIKNNRYGHRAAQAYTQKQDFIWALAKTLYKKHILHQGRSLREGMGLISVYE